MSKESLRRRRRQVNRIRRILFLGVPMIVVIIILICVAASLHKKQKAAEETSAGSGAVTAAGGTAGGSAAAVSGAEEVQSAGEAGEGSAAEGETDKRTQLLQQKEELAARSTAEGDLLLTFTGDCTLGTDEYFYWDTSLNAYFDMYGPDYFLQNVRDIFQQDDLTIINMEGPLTEETAREMKTFAFKGDPEFVQILTGSSVEAANLANNHSSDYGEKSFTDTVDLLESNGIETFGYDDVTVIETNGIKVGLTGIYELDDHLERKEQVSANISKLKEEGADLIVAVFHWGNELEPSPDLNQMTLAHYAVDEGADIVVAHHPHVLQGIERYKGAPIFYSLGNFCFGGNTSPTEMDTAIVQTDIHLNGDGTKEIKLNVIPCCVSSVWEYNDYCPTPLTGDEAAMTLQKILERSIMIPWAGEYVGMDREAFRESEIYDPTDDSYTPALDFLGDETAEESGDEPGTDGTEEEAAAE